MLFTRSWAESHSPSSGEHQRVEFRRILLLALELLIGDLSLVQIEASFLADWSAPATWFSLSRTSLYLDSSEASRLLTSRSRSRRAASYRAFCSRTAGHFSSYFSLSAVYLRSRRRRPP